MFKPELTGNTVKANPIPVTKSALEELTTVPGLPFFKEEDINLAVEPRGAFVMRKALVCGVFAILKYGKGWSVTHVPTGARIVEALSQDSAKRFVSKLLALDLDWKFYDIEVTKEQVFQDSVKQIMKEFFLAGEIRIAGYTAEERIAELRRQGKFPPAEETEGDNSER